MAAKGARRSAVAYVERYDMGNGYKSIKKLKGRIRLKESNLYSGENQNPGF